MVNLVVVSSVGIKRVVFISKLNCFKEVSAGCIALHSELLNMHYENTPIQIYRKFHLQNLIIFSKKILIFFIFLLKTYILGTL